MGIYDREYYRREGQSFLGSFSGRGQVCKWLIGINVVAFVIQLVSDPRIGAAGLVERGAVGWFTEAFWLDTTKVLEGQVWRLLTYAFLHDPFSAFHIIFNMLFLWWFGSDVEDLYGPREFLAIYLLSAVVGGVAFVLQNAAHLGGAYCLGASGAVTAVLVLCAMHYPSRVIYLSFLIPIPIWLFVVIQVAQDLYGLIGGNAGHTAVSVHLGGAAFAFLYYKRHWRLLSLWSEFQEWRRQLFRPRLRVYREEPRERERVRVATPPSDEADEDQLEAQLDAVLAKVARSGKNSLTERENQILLRASEVYKRRRT
jgi:membrane associated rhomboid family serine protease